MSRLRPVLRPNVLMWIGLLAAPGAWALQHVAGLEFQFAQCHDGAAGPTWNVHIDAWTIVISAGAAAIAILGGLAALATWRGVRDAEEDEAPPSGRLYFMGVVGMTISPLFLAIILMSGLGEIFLPGCVQS